MNAYAQYAKSGIIKEKKMPLVFISPVPNLTIAVLATEKPVNEYDINKDGTATIADVAVLLDHLAGKASVEGGDLNGDGGVTIADVATLLDHLAGK